MKDWFIGNAIIISAAVGTYLIWVALWTFVKSMHLSRSNEGLCGTGAAILSLYLGYLLTSLILKLLNKMQMRARR